MRLYNILSYSVILTLFIGLNACNNLDEYNPTGGETAETVWGNPDGFQTLINAAYVNQRNMYGKEDAAIMGEAGTDIWCRSGLTKNYLQLFWYESYSGSSAGTVWTFWRSIWPAINYCNTGIDRIDRAGYPNDLIKNQKLSELRYLRAFYYWHVVENWGGVCLRTHESNDVPLSAERSPVSEFYKVIIEDLEFAAKWLPVTQTDYGRPCRKAAYGFLARALLSRAYYSLDDNNKTEADGYFTQAKQVAHTVIDSATNWGVSLYPNYSDLWQNTGATSNNKTCKEALYVITNSFNWAKNFDANGNRLHLWFLASYNGKPGMTRDIANGRDGSALFMPSKYLLNVFNENLDSRYSATFQNTWICNTAFTWTAPLATTWGKNPSIVGNTFTVGTDTAIYISKYSVPDKRSKKYVVIDSDSLFAADTIRVPSNIYPSLLKFRDPNRTSATAQPGYLDIIVMRFAEMYMVAAEAEFQLGDNASAAIDINVLRKRASKTHSSDMDITAGDITLDFILDERAREFAGEHQRWYDLKRTRTLTQRIAKYNANIHIPAILLEKGNGKFENCLVRPIPQKELDALLNAAEFGQNPGYY